MADTVFDSTFTEKYRPKSLDRVLLLPRIRKELENGITQNFILHSTSPGTGKTTCARILCQGHEVKYFNGSTSGIDVVKQDIARFGSTMSILEEGSKVVYIDEADGLTRQAWDGLREMIERFAGDVKYIVTCNNINKIPDFIQSRFNVIPFYPINKEEEDMLFSAYVAYAGALLKKHNIAFEQDVVSQFVKNCFPDMRKILTAVQALVNKGETELRKDSIAKSYDYTELFEMMINGGAPEENYKYIIENCSSSVDETLAAISSSFPQYLIDTHKEFMAAIPGVIIAIAGYLHQSVTCPDKLVTLEACVFRCQQLIKECR